MSQLEHTIIFENKLTTKTVQNLINTISQYHYVNLYFSTNGGRMDMANVLIDFLNQRYLNNSLKLTLFNFVSSAGTLLLLDYNGPIFVKDLRGFMFHSPDMALSTIRKDIYQRGVEDVMMEDNEAYFDRLMHLGLTKSEIKKIKEGEDVHFFRKDFHRLKVDLFIGEETSTTQYIITKPHK